MGSNLAVVNQFPVDLSSGASASCGRPPSGEPAAEMSG